jgi:hypothetical protein
VAIVRGFRVQRPESADPGARPLVRAAADDLFSAGTHDAREALVHDSAPAAIDDTDAPVPVRTLVRAVDSLGDISAKLVVHDDGRWITALGSPLDVGYALGRLMAALTAEGVKASQPVTIEDGAQVRVAAASD